MADVQPKPGLQPLPLGNVAPAAAKPEAPSLDEKVDEWLSSHPTDKSFAEAPPSSVATGEAQPPTTDVPPGGEPAPGTAEPPPSGTPTDAPPTVTPPTAEPQAKVEASQPPQVKPEEKKPAAAVEPVRFSLDNKYKFADDGPEWTGQQVVDALRERHALIPKAQEADVYHEVFEMPAAQAKELWAPNIAWLRQNPQQVQMIASIIDDPQKAAYMTSCSQYWDSPEGQQLRAQAAPPQQQPAAMSPDVEARFKQLETQNQQLLAAEKTRKEAVARERVTRDLNIALQRYPYLRDNPAMIESLLHRASWINGGDDGPNAKGILDALEMEKDLYDAKLHALNGATAIAQEAAAAPVPPLMGSAGAAPQATASQRAQQPKKFGSLDDAVDEWFNNPPPQFR